MSFFTVKVALPRTAELTICACDEQLAERAATEFVETAFANALNFWSHDERITDDEGRLLGAVQIEMLNEGHIELAEGAVEITATGGGAATTQPINRFVGKRNP